MITRLVKMTFNANYINLFPAVFASVQPKIAAFSGCIGVDLLQDDGNLSVFFTISHWESQDALENYRTSPLFRETWATVKIHFADKPEAWSLLKT